PAPARVSGGRDHPGRRLPPGGRSQSTDHDRALSPCGRAPASRPDRGGAQRRDARLRRGVDTGLGQSVQLMYRPGAAPSGEPVYVDTVLREHVDRASELLALLRSACLEGTGPDSLDDLWARAEANVNALSLDPRAAIDAAFGAIPEDTDAGSVAALLLAECG